MEERFVYELTIDPDAENNTHAFALGMIGYSKRVLEVGCATGYFTRVLAERGCKVTGIEIDHGAAEQAENWADRVIVGSADDAEVWDQIDDEAYDVITFGDVLEHLQNPLTVLRSSLQKLKPSGFVVTSLPNIAHGDVRLSLLHGSFQYREIGLLDRTHIRFFTVQSVRELLRDAGLLVVDTRRVIMPMFNTELGLRREDFPEAVLDEIRADAEYETYQFVMKSVLDNGSQAVAEMAHHVEQLSDEVHAVQVNNRRLQDELVGHDELKAEYALISEQMQQFADHIEDLTRQVYQLHGELEDAGRHRAESEQASASLRTSLEETAEALARSEQRNDEITRSRSYRMTAPLRWVRGSLRGSGRP